MLFFLGPKCSQIVRIGSSFEFLTSIHSKQTSFPEYLGYVRNAWDVGVCYCWSLVYSSGYMAKSRFSDVNKGWVKSKFYLDLRTEILPHKVSNIFFTFCKFFPNVGWMLGWFKNKTCLKIFSFWCLFLAVGRKVLFLIISLIGDEKRNCEF